MRNIYSGWLSGNALKLLACITMFLDHLGAFLFPGVLWLRLVGRIAMPLFAFTLAEGCFFTRSKGRHLALIGGMGLVTSTVASVATGEVQGDILITFALSCLVIGGLDALKQACFSERARAGRIALSAAALAAVLGGVVWLCCLSGIRIEYGLAGVLLPATVHLFDFRACGERGEALSAVLYHPVSAILPFAAGLIVLSLVQGWAQWFSLAALLPIAFYSGERGRRQLKYFFYLFYPAHLALLGGIALFLL